MLEATCQSSVSASSAGTPTITYVAADGRRVLGARKLPAGPVLVRRREITAAAIALSCPVLP
jgi:hypothetical protein